jgi:hypothetical protein
MNNKNTTAMKIQKSLKIANKNDLHIRRPCHYGQIYFNPNPEYASCGQFEIVRDDDGSEGRYDFSEEDVLANDWLVE